MPDLAMKQDYLLKQTSISSLSLWKITSIKVCLTQSFIKLWTAALKRLKEVFRFIFILFVSAYRTIGTTHLGGSCRFEPSCSQYALDAIQEHPIHHAIWLTFKRVCRCRPGVPCGYDPVPKGISDAKK